MKRNILIAAMVVCAGVSAASAAPVHPVKYAKAVGHAAVHGVTSGAKAVEGCVRKVMH